jgi:hypothetical protein
MQGLMDVVQVMIGGVDQSGIPNLDTLRISASLITLLMVFIITFFVYRVRNRRMERQWFQDAELFGIALEENFRDPHQHSINEVLDALFCDYGKEIADGIASALMRKRTFRPICSLNNYN